MLNSICPVMPTNYRAPHQIISSILVYNQMLGPYILSTNFLLPMVYKRWIHNGEVVCLFSWLCNVSQVNEQTFITLGISVIQYKPTKMHLL